MTNISQWNFFPVVGNKEQIFKIQILHQMKEISLKKSIDEIIDILVPKIPRIEKEPYYETIQNVMIKIETYQKSMISIFDEIEIMKD